MTYNVFSGTLNPTQSTMCATSSPLRHTASCHPVIFVSRYLKAAIAGTLASLGLYQLETAVQCRHGWCGVRRPGQSMMQLP